MTTNYYVGIDKGAPQNFYKGGSFYGVTADTSTTSKTVEVRWETTAGVKLTKQELLNALANIIGFIEDATDLPLDLTT